MGEARGKHNSQAVNVRRGAVDCWEIRAAVREKKRGRFVLKQQLTSSTSNSSITSDLKPRAGEANMNLYAERRSDDDCSD